MLEMEEKKPAIKSATGKVVDAYMLNVREEPDISSAVKVVILNNAIVTIDLSFNDKDWYKIETATGEMGFVMKKYIAKKG